MLSMIDFALLAEEPIIVTTRILTEHIDILMMNGAEATLKIPLNNPEICHKQRLKE